MCLKLKKKMFHISVVETSGSTIDHLEVYRKAHQLKPVESHDTVDDEELEDARLLVHLGAGKVQVLHLLVTTIEYINWGSHNTCKTSCYNLYETIYSCKKYRKD